MLWLIPMLAAAEPMLTEIRLYASAPVPGVVLRSSSERLTDPAGYRLEPVEVTGTGRPRSGREFRQVTHADGRSSLIHAGMVGVLGGTAGGYGFYLSDAYPEPDGAQVHWLGVVGAESTLAAWIPAYHGAAVRLLPGVELPGADAVIAVEAWRESCPGTTEWTVLAVADRKLVTVARVTSSGEAGWYTSESVYLPTRQADGTLAAVSTEGDVLDRPAVAGQIVIRREVGEPTEEGSYTSRVVERGEEVRAWAQ